MSFSRAKRSDLSGIASAFGKLVDDLNRFHPPAWKYPVFVDDLEAANGNLKVGYPYVTPDGFIKRRVT